ncbi:MAG: hypothetical protein ACTIJJ_10990 [Galactobacter sp.]
MTSDGNGYGTGPDETPRYGVRTPGGAPNPQGSPNPQAPQAPQQSGWDTPRDNQTFGPYVPDNPPAGGWSQPGSGQGYVPGYPAPQAPTRRPGQVTAASIILWVAAGLYTILMLSSMSTFLGGDLKSQLLSAADSMPESQAETYRDALDLYSESMLQGVIYFTMAIIVAVGIVAAVAAWRTWKGSNAWRIAGTVCGGAMAAYQLLMVLFSPVVGVPGLAICIVVIVLWFSQPATAWFRARSAKRY